MEGATPSARDVAAKIFGRPGLVSSSKNIKDYVTTPSEDATPRTLIGGILDAASVSKSGLVATQTRKSKLTKSPATGPPQKKKKAIRQSLGDNATPRTIIKNFLMEASPETPLVVPLKLPENIFQDDDSDTRSQSLPYDMQASTSSPQQDSSTAENEIPDHEMDSLPNSKDSQTPLAGEMKKGNDFFLRQNSVNKDNEYAKVVSRVPATTDADIPIIAPEGVNEFSTRTITNDKQESHSDSIPDEDIIMPPVNTSSEPPKKSRWKDLVTPHLPLRTRKILSEKQTAQEEVEEEESKRAPKAVKKPPTINKRTKTKSTSSGDTNLPSGLVKSIFQHFSKSRISRNTLNSIEKGSSVFFKQVSSDLMAYSSHAGRSTIEFGDVELLMKRQGFITDKQSLNSLIEKYLPLEYRQELIPVVQSGNNVVLKKSN